MSDRDNVRRRGDLGQPTNLAVRRYKLNATLSAGGSAQAYWVVWNPNAGPAAYQAQDGTGGRPTDSFALYSGPNNFTGNSGDCGYAAYFPDRGQWEAITGGGAPLAIGTLDHDLTAGGNTTCTITIGAGGTDGSDPTVYDALLCSGDVLAAGTKVVIAKFAGKWYVIQAVCPCV